MAGRKDDPRMLDDLQTFVDAMCEQLEVEPPLSTEDRDALLGLTGVAAHTVVRPAAPFASLIAGYLLGSGRADGWTDAADTLKRFIRDYVGDPAPEPGDDEPPAPRGDAESPAHK